MEAKIKIAVLCFDVSDIDIITVNNRLMETLKQNIDLPEKEKLRRLIGLILIKRYLCSQRIRTRHSS